MKRFWTVGGSLRNQRGFSFIELMIALVIISLVIGGYIGANILAQRNSEELNERTVAIQDANRAIERIRDVSKTGTFPANVAAANISMSDISHLPDEDIAVSYVDTTANPLDISVTVSWTSYTGRTNSETVQTYITQR